MIIKIEDLIKKFKEKIVLNIKPTPAKNSSNKKY